MQIPPNLIFERAGRRYEVHHPQPENDHDAPPYETQLIDRDGEYMLTCSPESRDRGLRCRFSVGPSEWAYVISSRSTSQYRAIMPGFEVEPHKQLIEVGAGLSQSVVQWADRAALLTSKRGPKPVVIDPANYALMAEMLDTAIDLAPQEEHMNHLLRLLRGLKYRCAAILDPERIRLLPLTLEDACIAQKDLRGSADTLVDCYAAATYIAVDYDRPDVYAQRRQVREFLYGLEHSLLKPEGKLFTIVPAHHS